MKPPKKIKTKKTQKNRPGSVYSSPIHQNISNNPLNVFLENYKWLIAVLILTIIIYSNAINAGLLNWDDNHYIELNPYIKSLDWASLKGIFTEYYFVNYHPLTSLTYAIEYHFFELNPKPYHITNIIIHLINVVLVFFLTKKWSSKVEIPIIAALLFAIHPMKVESVVWVSERKDVLYGMFFILSLIYYTHYLKNREKIKYLIYAFLFFLGSLMSKPAAVTLPLVMLATSFFINKKIIFKDWLQSIPFFILSLIFGLITLETQKDVVPPTDMSDMYSSLERVLLVLYSVYYYISRFFIPHNFSCIHPYPSVAGGIGLPTEYFIAPFILIAIVASIFFIKNPLKEKLIFGLLFFLLNIFIVLQILPVGQAIVSERYTYIPHIGIAFIAAYLYNLIPFGKIKFYFIAMPFLIFLTISSYIQVKVWEDDFSLWDKASQVYPLYYTPALQKAAYYEKQKNYDNAIVEINKAISINAFDYAAYNLRGNLHKEKHMFNEAILDYTQAIELERDSASLYYNRGTTYAYMNLYDKALIDFNIAITLDSTDNKSFTNRGNTKYMMGDKASACLDWEKGAILGNKDAMLMIEKNCK